MSPTETGESGGAAVGQVTSGPHSWRRLGGRLPLFVSGGPLFAFDLEQCEREADLIRWGAGSPFVRESAKVMQTQPVHRP